MEERDRHAALAAESREPQLRLGELPVGREKAAVLVRVGVADHHFEHPTLRPDAAAHERHLEQVPRDLRRPAQVVDRFEQRDDRQRAALHARRIREQARFLGEEVDAEHVGRVVRHAEDKAADRLAVEPIAHFTNQPEQAAELLGFRRRRGAISPQRASQLAHEPGAPCSRRRIGRLAGVSRAPQSGEGAGQSRSIVPHVEPEGAEAEPLDLAEKRPHEEVRSAGAARRDESGLEGTEVRH